jgi:hypothetical protein
MGLLNTLQGRVNRQWNLELHEPFSFELQLLMSDVANLRQKYTALGARARSGIDT